MSQKVYEIDNIKFPTELYYTNRHVWIRKMENRILVVGIDDLGQKLSGRISVITLIEEGQLVVPNKVFGVMESMKWVERLRSPVTGIIVEINMGLMSRPQTVNEDPYGLGWMVKIKATGDLDRELLGLVFEESIKDWAIKEIQEKGKPVGK